MAEAWGFFVLGLVLLALGGDSIVKGASGLAQKFGASPFVAGLLLVAAHGLLRGNADGLPAGPEPRAFRISHAGALLAEGRAAVMLQAAP